MAKYRKDSKAIGDELKEQGIELEDTDQSQVGKDNVNVAGGYEHLGKDLNDIPPNDERLRLAWERSRQESPEIEKGLSQVQQQEQDQENER